MLLGHSQCGGIQALLTHKARYQDDFITNWVSLIKTPHEQGEDADDYAKLALNHSYHNCLTFPWIKDRVQNKNLTIHRWFFDIKTGQIFTYCDAQNKYEVLD